VIYLCPLYLSLTPTHQYTHKNTQLQRATSHCHSFTVNICLSYGSRGDIVNACRSVAACVKGGDFALDEIDEKMISDRLSTGGGADPDLLIRTSGEYRLSNFLLWQVRCILCTIYAICYNTVPPQRYILQLFYLQF
jgi:undecaprenyl diphosphate synthase